MRFDWWLVRISANSKKFSVCVFVCFFFYFYFLPTSASISPKNRYSIMATEFRRKIEKVKSFFSRHSFTHHRVYGTMFLQQLCREFVLSGCQLCLCIMYMSYMCIYWASSTSLPKLKTKWIRGSKRSAILAEFQQYYLTRKSINVCESVCDVCAVLFSKTIHEQMAVHTQTFDVVFFTCSKVQTA